MDIKNRDHILTATCAVGLEDLIKKEAGDSGGKNVSCGRGVVFWRGGLESAYRVCLWSRFSSRVLLQLYEFKVTDEEDL